MQEIDDLFINIQETPGLYGLYSVTGLGKRDLIMYICHMLALQAHGNPLVFSLELSAEQWMKRMLEYGLSTDGISVEDSSWKISEMKQCIEKHSPTIVFVDYLKLIDDPDAINKLKVVSDEFSIPVVVKDNLGRNSGDNDPVYRRPQLFDLINTCDNNRTIGDFKKNLRQFTAIMLLHRSHDWYRNIGGGHAFHICNEAELKIIKFDYARPRTIYFDYSRFIPGREWNC